MSGPTIAVVDYGMGNQRSVQKALEHVGARAAITRDTAEIGAADGVVIPGVGAFPRAMANLRDLGLDASVKTAAAEGRPLLGICLGMQLLFDESAEFEPTRGLGLIAGQVTPLETGELRVPHIGWNEVRFERPSVLSEGLPAQGCAFYHVHSLAARPSDGNDLLATTEYGERFATAVARENVFGVQFHPEKSSAHGLRLLQSFADLCRPHAASAARAAAMRG